jgi:hypothetical protein
MSTPEQAIRLYGQRSPLRSKSFKLWLKWNQCPDLEIPAKYLRNRWLSTAAIAEDHGLTLGVYQSLLQMNSVVYEISWLVTSRRIRTMKSARRLVRQVMKN